LSEENVKVPGRDDVALVQRAQQGEDEAFATLFNQLHQLVLNYVYHMLGDRQAAEDVTQDAFIRAHERIGQLGPPWDFKSWVFRIASNLAVDYLRRNRRFVDLEEPTMMAEAPITKRPSERGVQRNEARLAVWSTLDAMPTVYRQALILREFNGQSYKEVSQALECTYANARQLVHRARMRFREQHGMRLSLEAGVERCRVLGDLLSAFHDGELDEQQRAAVEAHIKTCPQCRQTEEDLKKVGALIAGLAPIMPSQAWIAKVFDQLGIETVPTPGGAGGQGGPHAGSSSPPGGGAGGMGGGGSSAGWWNTISGWSWMMKMGAFIMASAIIIGGVVLTSLLLSPHPPSPLDPLPSEASDSEASDTPTPGAAQDSIVEDEPLAVTASPTLDNTATQTTTATLGPPVATGNENCNCRFGPSSDYDVVGYLLEDQSAPIDGRNAEWTWWWIERQDGYGHCWVWDGLVTVSGDTSAVPIIIPPPTSTPDDTTPPSVSISHSPSGSTRPASDDVVKFTAQAQDDGEIERIEIWVYPAGSNNPVQVAACQNTTSCVYSGGPYPPGNLIYYARAYDTAGNAGESKHHTLKIFSAVY
jgi:RNA polymerase sigma-70 factor, ECF subfamily